MTTFDPAGDPLAFRGALGTFATGVTVVTAQGARGPVGITANSFASLSLDPPLVCWSVANGAGRAPVFTGAAHFAIHVLAADQRDLAAAFTTQADAFGDMDPRLNQRDVPLLDHFLARFECDREGLVAAGDHTLIIGRVTEAVLRDGVPLVFHGGHFGGFAP